MKLEEIKIGMVGSYGFFDNVEIVEILTNTIILEDKLGNKQEVYTSLILKYFKPEKEI
jgi:hypothetical protein